MPNATPEDTEEPSTSTTGRRGRRKKVQTQQPEPLVSTDDEEPPPTKPKRGRKKKKALPEKVDASVANTSLEAKHTTDNETPKPKPAVRRPRGPKKAVVDEPDEPDPDVPPMILDVSSNGMIFGELLPLNIKGRPLKSELSRREKIELEIRKKIKFLQCGNCDEQVPIKLWKEHGRKHDGIYWRVGIDEPIVSMKHFFSTLSTQYWITLNSK